MSITINGTTGISGVDGSSTTPAFQGTDTDTGLFYSANTVSVSAGGSKVATINAYGIGLGTGSPSSGIGITFPATQSASSDANTLDDYEEGTWTPTLTGSSGSATYNSQSGTYVKIGSMVTLNFWIYGSSKSTLAGNVTIALPFTVTSVNSVRPASIMLSNSLTLTGQLGGWVDSGGSTYNLQISNNGGKTELNATGIPSSSFEIYGSFSYRASA